MSSGGHWQRSGEELLRLLASVETRMRRDYAASLELIAELSARDTAVGVGYPNLAVLLRDVLRISPRDATRRLSHAAAVTETPAVSGGMVPAPLPVVGAALRDGILSADHLDVIAKTLSDLPLHVPDTDREVAEQTLVDAAHSMDARTLTKVGHRIRAWLDQDGQPPHDQALAEPVNELHLHTRRNGRLALRGELDPEASALFTTMLSPLAKPRPSNDTGPDPRSAAERQGDALVEILHLAADSGHLPTEAGEKPHLLVTVPLHLLHTNTGTTPLLDGLARPPDHTSANNSAQPPGPDSSARQPGRAAPDGPAHHAHPAGANHPARQVGCDGSGGLARPPSCDALDGPGQHAAPGSRAQRHGGAHPDRRPTGHAILDGVGPIDAASARRIACDAKVIPAVLGSRSEPLDLGRATYTVPTALRRALILRDGGCAFAGCDRTHRQCHGHHIRHWADGGPTQLKNLVLLCGRHHRLIHHSEWECAIIDGQAEFRPPTFLDPERVPRRNQLHKPLRGCA